MIAYLLGVVAIIVVVCEVQADLTLTVLSIAAETHSNIVISS